MFYEIHLEIQLSDGQWEHFTSDSFESFEEAEAIYREVGGVLETGLSPNVFSLEIVS